LWRNTVEDARWSIKPLCLGLAAVWAFDVYHFADALLFSRLDPDLWIARGFVYTLVVPVLAVSAFRVRADVFRVRLSRRVVFHTATLVAAGAYLLSMAGAGYYVRYFGGDWGPALQVALLFGAALALGLVIVSGSMRAKMRVFVGKHFFSYRYDYRDEWLRFTQALAATGSQPEMGQQIVRALADLVESPAGALWVRDAAGRAYVQAAFWNMPEDAAEEPVESALATFLRDSGWVVNLEEYRSSPLRYGDLELPEWLRHTPHAWLVVPLAVGSDLIGFAILATARTRIDVNWEVNDLLKTAARQAASFLGQMRAAEALIEARKFDAFNRMSAFVVHDLKNIVSQLSLMLKNAERHRDNPEFQKDMLETVAHSVERMKQLMLQLREGTTPIDAPQGVELAQLVARVGRAKAAQAPAPGVSVDGPLSVRGHEDRLERVIGHLVQNAQDATPPTGRVWIKLTRDDRCATVEVGDTGHGMTPEFVRDRLFKPFQTTKQAGMGIGAYESAQYVRELGGRMSVNSAPGAGTRVTLRLPLFDVGVTDNHAAGEAPAQTAKARP
jgi:putative PEP-CTERM system histidine kinase